MTEQEYKETSETLAKASELHDLANRMKDVSQMSIGTNWMSMCFMQDGRRQEFCFCNTDCEVAFGAYRVSNETLASIATAIHDCAIKEAEKAQAEFDAL